MDVRELIELLSKHDKSLEIAIGSKNTGIIELATSIDTEIGENGNGLLIINAD